MKQTAVQWYIEKLNQIDRRSLGSLLQLEEQALQMEREQIEGAFNQGYRDVEHQTASEYFTQTFKH